MCGGDSWFTNNVVSNPFVNPAAAAIPSLRENWNDTVDDFDIPEFTKPVVKGGTDAILHNAGGMADAVNTLVKGGSLDQAIMESGDHDYMVGGPTYAVQSHFPSMSKKVGPYAAGIGGAIGSYFFPAFAPAIAAGSAVIGNQLKNGPEYYENRKNPDSNYYTDSRQLGTKAAGTAIALQGISKLYSDSSIGGADLEGSAESIDTAEQTGNVAGEEAIQASQEGIADTGEGISTVASGVGERAANTGIDLTTRVPITPEQYDVIYGGINPGIVGNIQSLPINLEVYKALNQPVTTSELSNLQVAIENNNMMNNLYNESQAHPGAMYQVSGPSINPYAEADVNSIYENIRPAPANPGYDYPIADPETGLPIYDPAMYDYSIDPETGDRIYSDQVTEGSPAYDTRTVDELYNDPYNVLGDEIGKGEWGSLIKDLLKTALRGFNSIGESEETVPGYTKSWFGGSGLEMPDEGYYPNRDKGRRDLGDSLLKGTNLDLNDLLGLYLEDYAKAGR